MCDAEAAALRRDLARIRAQGYAYDDREFADDMRCVAVPVFEPSGKVESGISISGPIPRFDFDKLDALRTLMSDAAQRLSKRLAGEPAEGRGALPGEAASGRWR